MVDPITTNRLMYRALFIGLAALFLFTRLLPLSTEPTTWPGPNLLICLTIAWLLRRPDYVPVGIIVLVFLFEDMLLMRPPGLWAMLALLATEFLRDREATTRDLAFPVEWALASVVIVTMTALNALILGITMVPQGGFTLTLRQLLMTILAYPFIVLASHYLFGLRKAVPGEVDGLGHRL